MSTYSRYAAQAPSGGDVFPPEESEGKYESSDLSGMNNYVSDAREAALQRQRDLALQRQKQRSVGGVMTTDMSGPRAVSRGAPSNFGPRMDTNDSSMQGYSSESVSRTVTATDHPNGSNYYGGGYDGPRSSAVTSSARAGQGGHEMHQSAGGSMLSDALRERERRTFLSADDGRNDGSIERDLAARGIASSYDPASDPANVQQHGGRGSANQGNDRASRGGNASNGVPASSLGSAAANNSRVPTTVGAGAAAHVVANSVASNSGRASPDDQSDMPVQPLVMQVPMGLNGTGNSLRRVGSNGGDPSLLDFSDLRKFLTAPTPQGAGVVQCYIERDKSGISNRMYPLYTLHLVDGDRFLLASKKRTNNKTSNYLVTMDKRDLNRDSASFLGKVRSNFVGTEFTLFDDGASPEGGAKGSGAGGAGGGLGGELRQELGVVNYASNVLGSRGPRKMKVAVPKVLNDGSNRRIMFQPDRDEDNMMAKFKAGYIQDMQLLINKPPKWNDQVGAYVLNFNGRVTMASVKNFQLVSPDDHETVVLQFGRTGKDTFSMDYQWPLSPLQAFAICLSSFDYKLACE